MTVLSATMIESAGFVRTITEAHFVSHVVCSIAMPSFTSGAGHIVFTPCVSMANDVTQCHNKIGL